MSSDQHLEGEPRSLIAKMCEVGETLTWVQKRGKNTFHGYNYATESDLVLQIRLELYKRKVFLTPRVISSKVTDFPPIEGERGKVKYRRIVDLEIEWTWRDGESGETLVTSMPGSGEDSGDKGTYKAITGSEKYLLLKTFLIPTYDDAEAMGPTDKKELAKRVGEEKTAALRAQKAAKEAQSEEEAEAELRKGQILYIRDSERFHGEHVAVYGKPIFDAGMENFFADCAAQRFKAQEGIIYKLDVRYRSDCEAKAKQRGFTVKVIEDAN